MDAETATARAAAALAEVQLTAYHELAATAQTLTRLYQGGHLPPAEVRLTHAAHVQRLADRGWQACRLALLAPEPVAQEHLTRMRVYTAGVLSLGQMLVGAEEVRP